jgi:hypothetical protein
MDGSELDRTEDEFTGAGTFRGVNPATGVVLYYQLPELKKTTRSRWRSKTPRETSFAAFLQKLMRSLSEIRFRPKTRSAAAESERTEPVCVGPALSDDGGRAERAHRRRFRRTQSPAGKIHITLKMGGQTLSTEAEILANPLYPTDAADLH